MLLARFADQGRQVVVYQMRVQTAEPVAMVLPLPVAAGTGEHALEFIDLEGYAALFDDLASGFPALLAPKSRGMFQAGAVPEVPKLVVHDVGAFEASYVPSIGDFARLGVLGDRRNADVWVGVRPRRDRALVEALVAAIAPDAVAERLACLDAVEYPGWTDADEMKLAFVKLWHEGQGTLEDLVAEPHAHWHPLRSRALRPNALAADYPNLPTPAREATDQADADRVDAWLNALVGQRAN